MEKRQTAFDDYMESRELVKIVRRYPFQCQTNLNVEYFRRLSFKSEGMSGDVLASAKIFIDNNDIEIVIKLFKVPCPYRQYKLGNKIITKSRNIDDKNRYEIGNTLLLTNVILLHNHNLTPHLTFAYYGGVCYSAYETTVSHCNPHHVVTQHNYLVPTNCEGKYEQFPQCAFQNEYLSGELSDTIRYLVVERAHGDLEQWILDNIHTKDFDYILLSQLVMIAYTLYVLDDYFDGFVHGDLGPRNILYTQNMYSDYYWHYQLNHDNFYIHSHGITPKLWDFSTTYINNVNPLYFDYISGDTNKIMLLREDLTILFNKIINLIIETNSHVLPVMNDIMIYSQKMRNKDICMLFLTSNIVYNTFVNIDINDYQIEQFFSYSSK